MAGKAAGDQARKFGPAAKQSSLFFKHGISAAESNARYRYLLSQGTTGLSVAFDLPTQIGLDPDHPLAAGEVGKVGVSIASLADMRRLFEGIMLDQVSTSMTINSTAAILLSLYVLVARQQGADSRKIQRTIPNYI